MGIRGLTTFVNNRSQEYFDNYELHDCNLVIDGNSLACQLYKWHAKCNDCFGGDYDKYAHLVFQFFDLLKQCNITPYVIWDGGYEPRKLNTVNDRMEARIKSAKMLNSTTEGSVSHFPIFLSGAFRAVLNRLGIKQVTTPLEGDTEVACLAKCLNCPVLSYDSDFYIFDVLYIPFSSFTMHCCTRKNGSNTYQYISCQMYRIEKFLNTYGKLEKSILPLLAVLLGNDYIKRALFSEFYQHIKMPKGNANNEHQKRIKQVMIWLQKETVESATRKILGRYKLADRKKIIDQIKNAIKGYHLYDTKLLKYFELEPVVKISRVSLDENMFNVEENPEARSQSSTSSEDSDNEKVKLDDIPIHIKQVFLEKYENCLYPSCFMDLLTLHKYYPPVGLEDFSKNNFHFISFKIISAMHKILNKGGSKKPLIITSRDTYCNLKNYAVPEFEMEVPTLLEIQDMNEMDRKLLLLKILNIEPSFLDNCLSKFPDNWGLFLISIKYISTLKDIFPYYIYAFILNAIVLNFIDDKIGFYRSNKSFSSKYSNMIHSLLNKTKKFNITENILESIGNITKDDSILCMKELIYEFQMDYKMSQNARLYNRNVIHTYSEFLSAILHLNHLNCLLNSPFYRMEIFMFFDGTFFYNVSVNLCKRNLESYIKILLRNCPSVLNTLDLMVKNIQENTKPCQVSSTGRRKRKKKKKQESNEESLEPVSEDTDEDSSYDSNNKFSVLNSMKD